MEDLINSHDDCERTVPPRASLLARRLRRPQLTCRSASEECLGYSNVERRRWQPRSSKSDAADIVDKLGEWLAVVSLSGSRLKTGPEMQGYSAIDIRGTQAYQSDSSKLSLANSRHPSDLASFFRSRVPLIIDQPEDNLDGDSSTSGGAPRCAALRKHRAFIIVTHTQPRGLAMRAYHPAGVLAKLP